MTPKEQYYRYGESLGIKINDLQRLMLLAKASILEDEAGLITEDKAKEYTEKQYYKVDDVDEFNGEPLAVYRAYTQCQKDNKDKKYTEEDMLKLWNTLMVAMTNKNPIFFKDYINSLNKQNNEN
jgi:hypothetical protein